MMINLTKNMSVECYMMNESVNGIRYGVITSNDENGLIQFTTDCITIEKTYKTVNAMMKYLLNSTDWIPCNSYHLEKCNEQIHYIK